MKIQFIEAGRGVAILLVVLSHATGEDFSPLGLNPYVKPFGQWAVNFFFVLSGFIIPYVYRGEGVKTYIYRRFIRIFPTYWIVTAAIALYSGGSLYHIVASLLLIPQYEPPLLSIAWTLEREMIFYSIFALYIGLPRVGATVFAAWFLFLLADLHWGPPALWDQHNLLFFTGLFIATFLRSTPRVKIPDVQCSTVLVALGSAAYAIYLVHLPALILLHKLSPATGSVRALGFSTVGALGISFLFYLTVETPILHFLRRPVQ